MALQALFDNLRRGAVGWQAELHKRTLQQALLSLVGPQATRAVGGEVGPELANRAAQLGGADVLLVATDLGVDVVCAAEDAERVRGALDVPVVPEAAAEVLRVESGRPRYGLDLDDATIPQEAGLNERAVSFTKGCYVGQETVARLHYRGKPNRHLRGLRLSAPGGDGDPVGPRRARGRSGRLERRLPAPRSDRAGAGAPRGGGGRRARRRRGASRSSLSCRSPRSRPRALAALLALTASPREGVPPLAAVPGALALVAGHERGVCGGMAV